MILNSEIFFSFSTKYFQPSNNRRISSIKVMTKAQIDDFCHCSHTYLLPSLIALNKFGKFF